MIPRRLVLVGAAALALRCTHGRAGRGEYLRYAASLPMTTVQGWALDATALQGQVVLVSFFATYCFPCLAELVTLRKLASEYGARGFVNILVGMDLEGELVLRPFAEQTQLELPLVSADEALRSGATPFGHIRVLPTRVLFGRDGAPVVGFTGVARYEDLARLVAAEVTR
jgi:thiol-disulfide isomerase/thioredoxin